jgi:hypothetical protein
MRTAEEYRRLAVDCRREKDRPKSPADVRAALETLAQAYERQADAEDRKSPR